MAEIKNLKKAAAFVKKAIGNNEKIILLSDADLDGVASLIILEEAISNLNGRIVKKYIPDREKQGYGLSMAVLDDIKEFAPALLIVTDSGIANYQEIKQANKLGFKTIVIDHHEVQNKLPSAEFIIDPKQKGDNYPFKFMAACGLCFKFVSALLGKKMSLALEQSFLELVAVATISDMVPENNDNLFFIEKGLLTLKQSLRPSISAFYSILDIDLITSRELAQKIIYALQLTDFKDNLTESYLLLTSQDEKSALNLLNKLFKKSQVRHQFIKEMVDVIMEKNQQSKLSIIFEANPAIPHLITGSIASKLTRKLKKPSFVIAQKTKQSRGSARSPKNINCFLSLDFCQKHLTGFGGHPQASGFSLENKDINKLKKCLIKYFQK